MNKGHQNIQNKEKNQSNVVTVLKKEHHMHIICVICGGDDEMEVIVMKHG